MLLNQWLWETSRLKMMKKI